MKAIQSMKMVTKFSCINSGGDIDTLWGVLLVYKPKDKIILVSESMNETIPNMNDWEVVERKQDLINTMVNIKYVLREYKISRIIK